MGNNDHPNPNQRLFAVTSLDTVETESHRVVQFNTVDYTDPLPLSVDFRHSGWKHNRQLIAASLHRTHQSWSRQKSFCYCGSYAIVLRSLDDPNKYRLAGSTCHDRFCVPCATERSYMISTNVLDVAKDKQIRFLTLTIKTTNEPLSHSLDKIYRSFATLRRRLFWQQRVTGGVAFLENKWSDKGQRWHPHFHCLIEGSWIDRKLIQKAWREITGDSYIIDIRMPKSERQVIQYITKYASKPLNNTFLNHANLLDEAVLALRGRKLALTFGSWRGVLLWNPPDTSGWEFVTSLNTLIETAANGDTRSHDILAALTDLDLTKLLARSPPPIVARRSSPDDERQLTFWSIWDSHNLLTPPAA